MKKIWYVLTALASSIVALVLNYGAETKVIFRAKNWDLNPKSYFIARLPFPITWQMEVASITIMIFGSVIFVWYLLERAAKISDYTKTMKFPFFMVPAIFFWLITSIYCSNATVGLVLGIIGGTIMGTLIILEKKFRFIDDNEDKNETDYY